MLVPEAASCVATDGDVARTALGWLDLVNIVPSTGPSGVADNVGGAGVADSVWAPTAATLLKLGLVIAEPSKGGGVADNVCAAEALREGRPLKVCLGTPTVSPAVAAPEEPEPFMIGAVFNVGLGRGSAPTDELLGPPSGASLAGSDAASGGTSEEERSAALPRA
mmetsp:Transcript_42557/g.74781  ORF Transcript_42557/g.74781 Transcript_42557/m.74781 type:complete len:165 (-) Transcript_42557:800-1294(-)